MCNEHRRTVELGRISDAFAQLRIKLRFPEGAPNLAALDSIRITDPSAVVRWSASDDERAAELVQRRWSWPGPTGKPVFNYRSEGRDFRNSANHLRGGNRLLLEGDHRIQDIVIVDTRDRTRVTGDRRAYTDVSCRRTHGRLSG